MMSVGMLLFGACSQRSMPDEAESGMLSRQEGDAQEDADVQESGDASHPRTSLCCPHRIQNPDALFLSLSSENGRNGFFGGAFAVIVPVPGRNAFVLIPVNLRHFRIHAHIDPAL